MDETELTRRVLVAAINSEPGEREALEAEHGQVWATDELTKEFNVIGFLAPFIIVERLSDGQKGTLMFQHYPRYYFDWKADEPKVV